MSGCRRCAVFPARFLARFPAVFPAVSLAVWVALAGPACDGSRPPPVVPRDAGVATSRLAEDIASAEPRPRSALVARYYEGYLRETLNGDVAAASEAYEDVIARAGDGAPEVAARAALRLAEIEFVAGRRREALELMARASVLGRDDAEIVERADRLQERLGTLRSDGSQVRGPPVGTEPARASDRARAAFRAAEELLRAYHSIRLQPRLERLRAGVRTKESAMEAALRAYREVLDLGEPAADVAAEFRSASLQHDLALSLMFDLPPELEPSARVRLRRSLRTSALAHLRRAGAAYQRSLERARSLAAVPGSGDGDLGEFDRWTIAAELGLRSVRDLLGGQP